ncbi:unnamed protein product [Aphanomyces euteiches]|uniref:Multidrug/Oligosaccharidyl-lipid/Polysaccharide (MOP) Flippase Superfamily n=1 Tax=Aphanomyces euteiches TaxID=100861 RepID=A0A6G0W9G9_9STRA|nr:hypothetical protein Ae201684_017345 [Aphanomyces euteiches]KAH9088575.1 hypothetical protein Ae201684P_017184 [Aphanomyces euteiches]KAH9151083.1 hypothetical protein AeRB84_006231 [Aphanomyces euteiches]
MKSVQEDDANAPLFDDSTKKAYSNFVVVEVQPGYRTELVRLFKLAFPVYFAYILEFLPGTVCSALVGHLDSPDTNLYIDAAFLSATVTNITALSIGFGLATAMDTLCSQAFGAGKIEKLGIYMQSGFLVMGLALIPVFILNYNCEALLLMINQDPQVAALAGDFTRVTMAGIPFLFVYELIKKLLQSQNVVIPMTFIALLGLGVNIIFGYYFTYHTSMGFLGAALGRVVGNMAMPMAIVPYFWYNQELTRKWWFGWQWEEAKNHARGFLLLGLPGMFMLLVEWWAFSILAFLAGLLPDGIEAASINTVLHSILTTNFMIFLGISVAANVRIGNCLGANQPCQARFIARLAWMSTACLGVITGILITFLRHELPKIFINNPRTIEHASFALLFMVPMQFFDGLNGISQGILRGLGRQHVGAVVNAIAYYMVGLPLAYVVGFMYEYDIEGVWAGMSTGSITATIIYVVMIRSTQWQTMADKARERVEK